MLGDAWKFWEILGIHVEGSWTLRAAVLVELGSWKRREMKEEREERGEALFPLLFGWQSRNKGEYLFRQRNNRWIKWRIYCRECLWCVCILGRAITHFRMPYILLVVFLSCWYAEFMDAILIFNGLLCFCNVIFFPLKEKKSWWAVLVWKTLAHIEQKTFRIIVIEK